MDYNNEKKTKELELGKDTSTTEEQKVNQTTKSKGRVVNENDANSFYDGGSDKDGSAWLTDWRGKTLIFLIILLILIGIAIPSGMAIAGYFSQENQDYPFSDIDDDSQVAKDFKNIQNDAIVDYLDELYAQGFYSEKYFKKLKKDAKEDVDDQIEEEKDEAKDTYGDEYSDPWNHSLEEKGFNNEDQYRASLLSSKYRTEEIKKIVNKSYFTKTAYKDEEVKTTDVPLYQSEKTGGRNRYKYISDDDAIKTFIKTDADYDGDIISPEDLMNLYLYVYQPVVFNASTLDFTTKGTDGSTTLDPFSVSLTNDQLLNFWNLSQLGDTKFEPQNYKDGEIQSMTGISTTSAEDLALYSAKSESFTDTAAWDSFTTTDPGFMASVSALDRDTVLGMPDNDLGDISKLLLTSLQGSYLLDTPASKADAVSYERPLYSMAKLGGDDTSSRDDASVGNQYVTYFDTDGLHIIGVTENGNSKDHQTIVTNYLNLSNKSGNYSDLEDTGLWDSYSSFVTNNFNYIILYQALKDGKVFGDKGFASEYESTKEEYKAHVEYLYNKKVFDLVDTKYFALDSYVKENKDIYGYEAFKSDVSLFNTTTQFNFASKLFPAAAGGTLITPHNKVIKGGDDNE